MKKQTSKQTIYKRFKQFIILGTVAILTVTILTINIQTTAQYFLGNMYDTGLGVTKDRKKAVYWFKKSAEQGNATAQYFLGSMYDLGDGVTQDFKKAVYWWTRSAEQGNADAKKALEILKIK